MPTISDPARLALELAALGWHILPLSAASKRPLGNCPACRTQPGAAGHLARRLPLPGRRRLVPRRPRRHHRPRPDHRLVAARTRRGARRRRGPVRPGPGRHRRPRRLAPPRPGHRAAARHRPGRRTHPRAAVGRPGPLPRRPRHPAPAGPAPRRPPPLAGPAPEHRPVSVTTPSGGIHLWYPAPASTGCTRSSPTPRPVRAGLASRPQSRLVLRCRPRRRHRHRHLPHTRRRPRPARPHARLARRRVSARHRAPPSA